MTPISLAGGRVKIWQPADDVSREKKALRRMIFTFNFYEQEEDYALKKKILRIL